MPPEKRRQLSADQTFDPAEMFYRRLPPECLSPLGEVVPSQIRCSFGKIIKKSPSVVRSKYASVEDVLHPDCAGGADVSSHYIFFITTAELPINVDSGNKELYDFYPFHDPEDSCFAHTLIACKKTQSPAGSYDEPTPAVRNVLKAQFVSAFKNHRLK